MVEEKELLQMLASLSEKLNKITEENEELKKKINDLESKPVIQTGSSGFTTIVELSMQDRINLLLQKKDSPIPEMLSGTLLAKAWKKGLVDKAIPRVGSPDIPE